MRIVSALALVCLVACGGSDSTTDPSTNPDNERVIEGDDYQHVLSGLSLPTNEAEALAMAFDLDGNGKNDNQLGLTLAVLKELDLEFQTVVDAAITKGELILLLNLRTPSLTNAPLAGLWALFGSTPTPRPCANPADESTCGQHLKGDAEFQLASDTEGTFVEGTTVDSRFEGGPGDLAIQLPIGDGSPTTFRLSSARASFQLADGSLTDGILGGAIRERELADNVMPAIHGLVAGIVARDCTGMEAPCCEAGSTGNKLMFLDGDKDCKVSQEEFLGHPIIQQLFPLDMDLYNEAGELAPNEDGVKDSMSFGIAFIGSQASFPAPQQ